MKTVDKMLLTVWVWGKTSILRRIFGTKFSVENHFRNLLVDAAVAERVALPALYPVGAAANYSLLVAIFRSCTELPVTRVLEFGAGQSTLLLDSIGRGREGQMFVTTVEEDESWASRISGRVVHDVLCRKLEAVEVNGRSAMIYRGIDLLPKDINLFIVDGPIGTKRFSRWAATEAARHCLSEEFLIIVDDAERLGEQDTIRMLLQMFGERVRMHFVLGAKCQVLIYTKEFSASGYF